MDETQKDEVGYEIRNDVISFLSHEVRTALTIILGYAEMMYDARQSPTEKMRCIGGIRKNVSELKDILEGFTDLSQIENGTLPVELKKFSFSQEFADVFSFLKGEAGKRRLYFEIEMPENFPQMILSDPIRIREILVNVVLIALKFTERGGVTLAVRLNAPNENQPQQIEFDIQYTGTPFSPVQQEHLFEIPRDVEHCSPDSLGMRTDLWLYLIKKIAESLGGQVSYESGSGHSPSTFKISIQPTGLEWSSAIANSSDAAEGAVIPLVSYKANLKGIKILLVEDVPDIYVLARHFLEKSEATIEVARDGQEGLDKARRGNFDIILLDIQLPLLNGYQVAERLRAEKRTLPIIAVTAHAMKGVKERCLKAGFSDFMTKPISAQTLIHMVSQHTNRFSPMGARLTPDSVSRFKKKGGDEGSLR